MRSDQVVTGDTLRGPPRQRRAAPRKIVEERLEIVAFQVLQRLEKLTEPSERVHAPKILPGPGYLPVPADFARPRDLLCQQWQEVHDRKQLGALRRQPRHRPKPKRQQVLERPGHDLFHYHANCGNLCR